MVSNEPPEASNDHLRMVNMVLPVLELLTIALEKLTLDHTDAQLVTRRLRKKLNKLKSSHNVATKEQSPNTAETSGGLRQLTLFD